MVLYIIILYFGPRVNALGSTSLEPSPRKHVAHPFVETSDYSKIATGSGLEFQYGCNLIKRCMAHCGAVRPKYLVELAID